MTKSRVSLFDSTGFDSRNDEVDSFKSQLFTEWLKVFPERRSRTFERAILPQWTEKITLIAINFYTKIRKRINI